MSAVRPLLEDLAGTAAFYLLYLAIGSARIAASVGLAVGVVQITLHLFRRRPVPTLLATGVALTVTLGAATFVSRDARFLLLKPSIIYFAIATTMLPRGWFRRYLPQVAVERLSPRTVDRAGWVWSALMYALAAANLGLVASLPPRRAAAIFLIIGTASKFGLFAAQYAILKGKARRSPANVRLKGAA